MACITSHLHRQPAQAATFTYAHACRCFLIIASIPLDDDFDDFTSLDEDSAFGAILDRFDFCIYRDVDPFAILSCMLFGRGSYAALFTIR